MRLHDFDFCSICAKQINVNWMLIKKFSLWWIKLAIHVNLEYIASRYINHSFSEYKSYTYSLHTIYVLRTFFCWTSLSKVTQSHMNTIMNVCTRTFTAQNMDVSEYSDIYKLLYKFTIWFYAFYGIIDILGWQVIAKLLKVLNL